MFLEPVFLVRVLLTLVAFFNVCWSWRGALDLYRKRSWPVSVYRTGVFLSSVGICILNMLVFFGDIVAMVDPITLFGFVSILLGQLTFAVGRFLNVEAKADKFFYIYRNLDIVLPLLELNEVDSDKATKIRQQATTQLLRVLKGQDDKEGSDDAESS